MRKKFLLTLVIVALSFGVTLAVKSRNNHSMSLYELNVSAIDEGDSNFRIHCASGDHHCSCMFRCPVCRTLWESTRDGIGSAVGICPICGTAFR